jgi:hypothetical protein
MKTAVPLLLFGTAVLFFLTGCATPLETPVRKPLHCEVPAPLRVAILPPRLHPDLNPASLKADQPLHWQLLDGRGLVVTSADPGRKISLEIVAALSGAGKYERVFTAADEAEARALGANSLMRVTVWDYRAVLLGSNTRYPLMALTSPLMSQYWLRWRTLEARFEWEVKLSNIADGETLYLRRLKKSYTAPVRSATNKHFIAKMLSFLQDHTLPDFIGELFDLPMTPVEEFSLPDDSNEPTEPATVAVPELTAPDPVKVVPQG